MQSVSTLTSALITAPSFAERVGVAVTAVPDSLVGGSLERGDANPPSETVATVLADIAAAGGPMEQWQMVPEVGKLQILGAIFIIEHQSEWKIKPHYMAGGTPGSLKGLKNFWDPVGFTAKMDAKKLERQRLSELKNGRAAMLGIVGCLVGGNLPGSIPVPISWPVGASLTEPFGTFASYH